MNPYFQDVFTERPAEEIIRRLDSAAAVRRSNTRRK